MVYRPGERALAARVFELLGLRVLDQGGEWFFCLVDPASNDVANNACYASQVTAEQWALEQALTDVIAAVGRTASHRQWPWGSGSWLPRARPVRAPALVPFRDPVRNKEDFDATLERIRQAEQDPELGWTDQHQRDLRPRRAGRPRTEHGPGVRPDRRRLGGAARLRPTHRAAVAPPSPQGPCPGSSLSVGGTGSADAAPRQRSAYSSATSDIFRSRPTCPPTMFIPNDVRVRNSRTTTPSGPAS